MISWALVFAADIVAGLEARVKKLRMKEEMVGELFEMTGLREMGEEYTI